MDYSSFEQSVATQGNRLGLNLHAIRKSTATLLSSIPSAGFFRTYTDHSIAHCDQMLAVLSWLVPPGVRDELTYAENALLVLSVYFHDLGMLATEQEFLNRQEHQAFQRFEKAYIQQYDASSHREADHTSWDRFLFEEYLRSTHAQRIQDWLTGRHPELPQAQELQALLRDCPPQFSHYLGAVCKSHHLNNLHDIATYPVDARFGNAPDDKANIQFVAVALRLADILHMSRDRTPPLEFRLISPRNPVSAREWAKQIQVSGVGPSVDPTEIRVEALCTDHRMYFYLQDFIKVVNDELQRCRAWLGSAPLSRQYYLAHRIVTDAGIRADGFLAEKFQLELDHRRVIDLLMGHNLYGDPRVAIREVVQNSIDAVRVRAIETEDYTPTISVHHDRSARTLTFVDNGIGMDLEVIRRHFLRVGDSYYRSQAFRRRAPTYTPISQFGIGFLTAFMLGDRVEVVTRSSRPDAKTYAIYLENIYDLFLVRVLDEDVMAARPVRDGGTCITITLGENLKLESLAEQVQQWLVFLEFPIAVSVDGALPTEVWGLRGDTPEEVGKSIAARLEPGRRQYCPITFSKDDVDVTVLWEGSRIGERSLLAPAGRLLLPLTDAFSWDEGRVLRHRGEKSEVRVRKIANGGVFLGDNMPGLVIKDSSHIHYVVNCRGAKRFTPLVSRSGVAVDAACGEIVSDFIEGLIGRLGENVEELLKSGVSKYFVAYYAGQALNELFQHEKMETMDELALSVVLAVKYASRLRMALVKEGGDIALRSWDEHDGRPICVGQNVYRGLLRSVTYGYVEFPLPREVLESLPESYLVDVGTDAVLRPIFFLSRYSPIRVQYDNVLKGVFLHCEVPSAAAPKFETFGGLPVLSFPDGLGDVLAVKFSLAGCLNANHPGLSVGRQLVDEIVACRGVGEPEREKAEAFVVRLLLEAGWEWRRGPERMEPQDELRRIRHALEGEWEQASNVSLRREDIRAIGDARVIRDELWRYVT